MGSKGGFRVPFSTKGTVEYRAGQSADNAATLPINDFFIYEAAQVIDVVNNNTDRRSDPDNLSETVNTGVVRIRYVTGDRDTTTNIFTNAVTKPAPEDFVANMVEDWASPLLPHQTVYPLIGEYVLVFKFLDKLWYIGPINKKRKITENAEAPNLLNAPAQQGSTPDRRSIVLQNAARAGVTTSPANAAPQPFKPGQKFKDISANPLLPYEGDQIYQGRYGNSIRLGSSIMDQASNGEQFPNILIRAGQTATPAYTTDNVGGQSLVVENIDTDASSIYLVSNQFIKWAPATLGSNIHLASVPSTGTPTWDGAQIIINSDKVAINAKHTSIFMFAKEGVHINAQKQGFTVDSGGSIFLRTPSDMELYAEKTLEITSKKDITITTKRDVNISGDRNVTLYGNDIFIGGRSSTASPMVLGKPLKMFLFELLRVMMSNPAMIGAGVPNPAYIARLLLLFTKYQVFPDPFNPLFNSNDNFVLRTNERTMASDLPPTRGYKATSGTVGQPVPNAISYPESLQRFNRVNR